MGGRQAQATQHRDESQGEVFVRSLELVPLQWEAAGF